MWLSNILSSLLHFSFTIIHIYSTWWTNHLLPLCYFSGLTNTLTGFLHPCLSYYCTAPQIQPIVQELLKVIKETENDDLTNVMCKIVTTYTDQLTPIAVEMCTQLAATFQQVCVWVGGSAWVCISRDHPNLQPSCPSSLSPRFCCFILLYCHNS